MTDQTIAIRSNTVSKLTSQLDFVLMDGSFSMQDKWWDMLAALDTYVGTLKSNQIDSHLLMHIFDSTDLKLIGRDCHIRDHKNFVEDPIGAHFNSTPLYDAITIMGATLRDLNPARCSITIVTDGEDTGNKFSNLAQARSILDWCRAHGWTVTFIGCDFDNDKQARALGATPANSIGVQRHLLTAAAKTYAEKRTRNARTGDPINFTADEKVKFGGLLGHSGGVA